MDDHPVQQFQELEQDYQADDGTKDHTHSSLDMKCELRTFECRYNSRNEQVTLQVGESKQIKPKAVTTTSVLTLTRFYDIDNKSLKNTKLEIHSPHVKAALRNVIPSYPGIDLKADKISMKSTRCLFHYRKELSEYGVKLADLTAQKHLLFTLQYMYNSLQKGITSYYHYMESGTSTPGLEYEDLWMAFRPGELLYTEENGIQIIRHLTSISKGVARRTSLVI